MPRYNIQFIVSCRRLLLEHIYIYPEFLQNILRLKVILFCGFLFLDLITYRTIISHSHIQMKFTYRFALLCVHPSCGVRQTFFPVKLGQFNKIFNEILLLLYYCSITNNNTIQSVFIEDKD